MAKLFVSEYEKMTHGPSGLIPMEPCILDQIPVVIGAGSLQSLPFQGRTKYVRIHADVICSIAFGPNPTATTNSKRLIAGATQDFAVTAGDRVAVITNT